MSEYRIKNDFQRKAWADKGYCYNQLNKLYGYNSI